MKILAALAGLILFWGFSAWQLWGLWSTGELYIAGKLRPSRWVTIQEEPFSFLLYLGAHLTIVFFLPWCCARHGRGHLGSLRYLCDLCCSSR